MTDDAEPGRDVVVPQKPCPMCGKPAKVEHQPFCSRRCADVDLNRWLSGNYVLATDTTPDDEAGDDS